MAKAKQPVTIGGIEFDALIESTETWEADVPAYPVEDGFEVSDTISLKQLTLNMTLYLTNTAVTWSRHNSPSRVQDVIARLKKMYFDREPVTVSTSEQTYENMAIAVLDLTKTKETGSSREIPVTLREIRVTESRRTTIPDSYGRSGSTGANAGTAATAAAAVPSTAAADAAADAGSRGSLAYSLGSAVGLLGEGGSLGGIIGGLMS